MRKCFKNKNTENVKTRHTIKKHTVKDEGKEFNMMERLRREEAQSLDLVEENIKTLKRLFPDIVREGKTGGK